MTPFKTLVLFPFIMIGLFIKTLVYYFDRRFREERFAKLQSLQVLKSLIDLLLLFKTDIHLIQEELDSLIYSYKSNKTNLKDCRRLLKNKYGFNNIKKAIERDYDEGDNDTFELSELIKRAIRLEVSVREGNNENPEKIRELECKLAELEQQRNILDYTLINLNQHMNKGYIKHTTDILKVFEITESEVLLKHYSINIEKCGLDAYL